jgi:DNA-binding beta-propeller fold protein YncE
VERLIGAKVRERFAVILATAASLVAPPAFAEYVYEGEWGKYGQGLGRFRSLAGISVAANGNVYTVERTNRVQYFTAAGRWLGVWGFRGSYPGEFESPYGVAVPGAGRVYVADTGNDRVQYFTSSGSFLGMWGSQGPGPGQFSSPHDVAVAANGRVYVLESPWLGPGNNRVQYFTASGSFLGIWGRKGSADGEFEDAEGIAVAPNGNVYVADTGNDRVQYFTAAGSFLAKWGSYGQLNGEFNNPSGVAVSSDGRVFVVEVPREKARANFIIPRTSP